MFLKAIAELGFLEEDEGSSVFTCFPADVRMVIGQKVVGSILKGNVDPTMLRSESHINNIMELAGQVFSLEVKPSTYDIISASTELYRRWLVNVDNFRPKSMEANLPYFQCKMIDHYSLLFHCSDDADPNVSSEHARLCNAILDIYVKLCRDQLLDEDTTIHLIKVILGIAQHVLAPNPGSELGRLLSPTILRALIEIWIRSGTRDMELWGKLKELMPGWTHRMSCIVQWNATILGFTKYLFHVIYGDVGCTSVVIRVSNTITDIEVDTKYAVFCWYLFLHILGDLENITVGSNYHAAMKAIDSVSSFILSCSDTLGEKNVSAFNQNSILHVLGSFLSRAINAYDQKEDLTSSAKGRSQAMETLLAIVTKYASKHVLDSRYLSFTYYGIAKALASKHGLLVSTALHHASRIMSLDLPGATVLVPHFIAAIQKVLVEKVNLTPLVCSPVALRKSCMLLIGSFIPLITKFKGNKFLSICKELLEGKVVKQSKDLAKAIEEILLVSVDDEEDPGRIQHIIALGHFYALETFDTSANSFVRKFLSALLNHTVKSRNHKVWGVEPTFAAFQCIRSFANRANVIYNGKEKDLHGLQSNCANYIITSMSKSNPTPTPVIVVGCMGVLQEWMMSTDSIHTSPDILLLILRVLDITLGYVSGSYHTPSEPIRQAALSLFYILLNQKDEYPSVAGPARFSSLPSEEDLLEAARLESGAVSSYVLDNTVLSFVRYPRTNDPENGIALTLILRDASGKYVWSSKLSYFASPTQTVNAIELPQEDDLDPLQRVLDPLPVSYDEILCNHLDEDGKGVHNSILECTKERLDTEAEVLRSSNFGYSVDTKAVPCYAAGQAASDIDQVSSRLMLAHFGFLSMENRGSFHLLQADASKPFNFLQNFKGLDSALERPYYQVSVAYLPAGTRSLDELLAVSGGSGEFYNFLEHLGWIVDIDSHMGFKGGLNSEICGPVTPYYADSSCEMIFHVAPLFAEETDDKNAGQKKRFMSNDRVMILWVEDMIDFAAEDSKALRTEIEALTVLCIRVCPLPNGFFLVQADNSGNAPVSPLSHELVVSAHSLPHLVRCTVLSAHRWLSKDGTDPCVMRSLLLSDFHNRYALDVELNVFLKSFFS